MNAICRAIVISLLFTLQTIAHSQAPGVIWSYFYGGLGDDVACKLIETDDDGYVIVGHSGSFGSGSEVYIVKTDSAGAVEWETAFGGPGTDEANSVLQTANGDYLIAGISNSYSPVKQGVLYRIDSTGNVLWHQVYGDTTVNSRLDEVIDGIDGGYVVSGITDYRFYMLKVDELGEIIWERIYDPVGAMSCTMKSAISTSDSSYLMVGGDGYYGFHARKVDIAGNPIWDNSYGYGFPPWNSIFHSAIEVSDSVYALSGAFLHAYPYVLWRYGCIYLLSGDGDVIWNEQYSYQGGIDASLADIAPKPKPVQVLTAAGSSDSDVFIMHATVATGYKSWEMIWGGPGSDSAVSILEVEDDSYIIAGNTDSFGAGGSDVFLMRIGEPVGINPGENGIMPSGVLRIFPSPFSTTLYVYFDLEEPSQVSLYVFDLTGRIVSELEINSLSAGSHVYEWNPETELPDGCYTVLLDTGEEIAVQRCIRVR